MFKTSRSMFGGNPNEPFDKFFDDWNTFFNSTGTTDKQENDDDGNLTLKIPVPGLTKEDLTVKFEKDVLVIKVKENVEPEFVSKSVSKYTVPSKYDKSKTKASVKNGVLTINLILNEDNREEINIL